MPLFIIPFDGGTRNKVVCIPKPPRIGACVAREPHPRLAHPYAHTHHPDQDWLQGVLLNGTFTTGVAQWIIDTWEDLV